MIENLAELRAFVQIVESGRLVTAAKALQMPPMKVGRLLSALERRLALRLFNRTTRSLSITPDGRWLYDKALRILEDTDEVESDIVSRSNEVTGTLKISIRTTSVQMGFMKYLIPALCKHPRLSVQLLVTDDPVEVIASGVDISLQLGPLKDSSLKARYLGEIRFALAASPQYAKERGEPASTDDLKNHECLRAFQSPAVSRWSLVDKKGEIVFVSVRGRLECNDVRAQAEAMHLGMGIAPRPISEVRRGAKDKSLVWILPAYSLPPIQLYAVMPPRRPLHKRVDVGLRVLSDLMKEFQ